MLIITNFKTYETALGTEAIKLAKIHEEVSKIEPDTAFGVAPSALDLENICMECPGISVFAQHVDDAGLGSATGKIPPVFVKKLGATGTILNHSENRLSREYLEKCIKRAKEAGLKVIVCAETAEEGESFLEFDPDFIAIEPPELIGGDISVSTANPELIKDAVKRIGSNKVIVGAGVKNAEDVRIAKKLGASGILLASGVTKAKDPRAVLIDLASGAKA